MKPLKILYHHRTQGRGAEGVHIVSIVKALEAMGHEVTVVSPPGVDPLKTAGNAPVDKSKVKTSGVGSLWKFISNHLPNFLFELIEIAYNLPALFRLKKTLAEGDYDIIYERYAFYMISGAFIARRRGIPFVLEANEVNGIKDRARKQSFPRLCGIFERYLFKRCTAILTVSSYLKNMITAQNVAAEKVFVTPNAIDPQKFTGVKTDGNLRKELGIAAGNTVIGFAGWFDDWDRLDLLVDAFNNLLKSNSALTLLLVGDGAVLSLVREKAAKYGITDKIILTGPVERSKVHQYLSLLDIAVFTHSNEFGSPVVMFEFMGLKIPVVAPRLMPITDVLEHETNALLFDPLDIPGMENQLRQLIENASKRGALAESAYQQLLAQHTWQANAQQILTAAELG